MIKKYDPINYVENWSTPMLVIHGSKDYRLPETDGIGAFHALQQYVTAATLHVPSSNTNCSHPYTIGWASRAGSSSFPTKTIGS